MPNGAPEHQLREEFNRWAQAGRGEEMEESHLPIVAPTLALMDLQPADRVLDVGCGSGWLVRRLAALAPNGSVLGIDVSDEMVRRAQAASVGVPNSQFLRGTAEQIPAPPNSFTKVLSVESAYYWHDPVARIERNLSCARGRRLRVGPDQLLPRQSRLPPMEAPLPNPHAPTLCRRMAGPLPRRGFP